MTTKALTLSNNLTPVPVDITINHVDSSTTLHEHIDADCNLFTAQLALLMQTWPKLETLPEFLALSDHIMKVVKTRRELCLKPISVAEMEDNDIDITPMA